MRISEIIKQAREELGMTQEDLAERLEVSRQAVSKWELGASLPSPENLELLEEVLGVSFPPPEESPEEETAQAAPPPPASKQPFWTWERIVLLVLGVLIVSALFSAALFIALRAETNVDVPRHAEPSVTGIYFFDESGASLQPDYVNGARQFTPGIRVLVAVTFENPPGENPVDSVTMYLTPTPAERIWTREQEHRQSFSDGRTVALFPLDIPQALEEYLNIVLHCGNGLTHKSSIKITAPYLGEAPESPEGTEEGPLTLSSGEIHAAAGDTGQYILEAYGAPFAEVEWVSSDPSVARVANTGTVFIEGPGEAVVTASWKGQSAECRVHVEAVGEEGSTDLPEDSPEGPPEGSSILPPQYVPRTAE